MIAGVKPEDTVLRRLRVRGPPGDVQAIRAALAYASWPEADGGSWVFIRKVEARARKSRLVSILLSDTQDKIFTAKGPSHGGDAVRFENLAELIAWLLTDLTNGTAAQKWYWRRFARLFTLPTGNAVTEVLEENVAHLSSIAAYLDRLGVLLSVWRCIPAESAKRLAESVAARSGVSLVGFLHSAPTKASALPRVALPVRILLRWRSVAKMFDVEDTRVSLASVLAAQEAVPLLFRGDSDAVLNSVIRQLVPLGETAPREIPPSTEARSEQHRDIPQKSKAAGDPSSTDATRCVLDGTAVVGDNWLSRRIPNGASHRPDADIGTGLMSNGTDAPVGSVANRVEKRPDRIAPQSSIVRDQPGITDTTNSPIVEQSPVERVSGSVCVSNGTDLDTVSDLPFSTFTTSMGGLFYLLNFLNRSQIQEILKQHRHIMPSGWGWLYRLGQTLGLDEKDEVVRFLAGQLDLDGLESMSQLPALPAADTLLAFADRWYGKMGIWNIDLLRLDARVQFTLSHVDVYASLDSVRLPVRLTGLDINPGWLPWLGRVVTFYYERG